MTTRDELKADTLTRIEAHRDEIVELVQRIYAEPEIGYHEHQTASLVRQAFDRLGVPYQDGLARTAVKGELRGGAGSGPAVAILGELDALLVPNHMDAHPERQTAHACGHNAQIGSMIGATIGLGADHVLERLSGRVVPMAVPAEECIDLEDRLELRQDGEIEFLVGKAELIGRGAFEDVDMAMMVHTSANDDEGRFGLGQTTNGALVKRIQFVGRAAHAGGSPHRGVNALDAARLALAGIDAQRATFRDDDAVRVHPIVTQGGWSTSIVPADVRMETFVRGRTTEAIVDANAKVDRALRAGAMAMGATVRITTMPGYLPMSQNEALLQLFAGNAGSLVGADKLTSLGHRTGSTDMGDLGTIMPVIHPMAAGAVGTGHGADYQVVDFDNAVINPAKAMAMTVIDLLADGAAQAQRVVEGFQPQFGRAAYLDFIRELAYEHEFTDA